MTTTPIRVDLGQYDTHPILTWTIKRENGTTIQDLTGAARSVELWYWEDVDAGQVKRALWKVTLTKSGTPTDGTVAFTPSATEQFYPDALMSRGAGPRTFVGWLRYHDTGSSPITHKWIKHALEVAGEAAPLAP